MNKINPENFIAWMTTQPNANGTLYLERVARHYVSFLRNTPAKLDVTLTTEERNIFACGTIEEFEQLRTVLTATPNYRELNEKGHGSFSAGLRCYARYLSCIERKYDTERGKEEIKIVDVTTNDLPELLTYGRRLETLIATTSNRKERRNYEQMKWTCDKRIAEFQGLGTIKTIITETTIGMANEKKDTTENTTFQRVNFNTPQAYINTRPVDCVIEGARLTAEKWSDMYMNVCEHLLANRSKPLTVLKLRTKDGGTRPFFMEEPLDGLTCRKLSNGKYIITNYSAQNLISSIGMVLRTCIINLDTVVLTCTNITTSIKTSKPNVQPIISDYVHKPTVKLTDEERTAVEMVLESRYTNGFRLDTIELGRLRRFLLEYSNLELVLTDKELIDALKSCGTLFEGKVYTVTNETKQRIKQFAEDYFEDGAKAIFYEEFYAKNEYWLFEASVVSVEMLAGLLRRLFSRLEFTDTYFGYLSANINTVLVSEIFRIWGDDILLSYEQISERLHYIPLDRIKFALAQNSDFIWNSVEVFTHRTRIDATEDEWAAVREAAQRECNKHRYISVTDLPLDDFTERNYELSQTAIHNAAFNVYLSDEYDKRGKIITRKGEDMDALTIMREYCHSLDHVTLGELLDFEKDLTGESHRWVPMQAGYDVMVRIDEDTYLAEHYFNFDVESIDNALEHFVQDEYTPLRTVTTFAVFPHCGQLWNLFLLESYVRRFSKHFRFESPSVNNKNAGCIVRKHSKLNYDGIMIDAIAKSNLLLNDENTVADYLCNNGYRGSRQKAKLTDLIKQAKRLMERRG